MKKSFLILALLLVVVLAVALVAQFWLRPQVEEQLRRSLIAPAFADGVAIQTRAQEVAFSPFSRRVLARGVEMQALPPQGPVTCQIAEISLRLPWRALLACTPLRGAVLPESGMLPVAQDVALRNLRARTPQSEISVQRTEMTEIRAQSSLVAALLERQPILEPCDVLSRICVEEARASFITIDSPTVSRPEQIRVKEARARKWQGRSLQELTLAALEFRVDGLEVLRLDALSQGGLLLPSQALLRRLTEQVAARERSAAEILAEELYAADEPLLRKARLHGLTVATQAGPVNLKELNLDWSSNKPLHSRLALSGLSAPMSLFTGARGFSLPGLDTLRLDAEIGFAGQGKDAILEKCLFKVSDLGDLRYSLVTLGDTRGMSWSEALMSQSYGDFTLHYEDHGLLARLALATVPQAMAVMVFKTAIANFCALDTPENKAIATALETFVQRPGVLEINSLPGKSYRLGEVLDALRAGDFGALLRVSAQAGATSLEQQMARISAAMKPQP